MTALGGFPPGGFSFLLTSCQHGSEPGAFPPSVRASAEHERYVGVAGVVQAKPGESVLSRRPRVGWGTTAGGFEQSASLPNTGFCHPVSRFPIMVTK